MPTTVASSAAQGNLLEQSQRVLCGGESTTRVEAPRVPLLLARSWWRGSVRWLAHQPFLRNMECQHRTGLSCFCTMMPLSSPSPSLPPCEHEPGAAPRAGFLLLACCHLPPPGTPVCPPHLACHCTHMCVSCASREPTCPAFWIVSKLSSADPTPAGLGRARCI